MGFNHSIKVPTQYKKAAATFKQALNEGKSVKNSVFEQRHARLSNLLALLNKYSNNKGVIETAIEKSNILTDNPRLDPNLCRVLVTELLFGTKSLKSEAKPVLCVLTYKDKLEEHLNSTDSSEGGHQSHGSNKNQAALKPRYVRINTNLISLDEAIELLENEEKWRKVDKTFSSYDEYLKAIKELEEYQYALDIHVPNLLVFTPKWKSYWAQHQLTLEKKFMLQDKATNFAALFLNPSPGSTVLDMCAAPGMKTIQLSNIMKNSGKIYAVERDESRYKTLCKMVKDAKATIVEPILGDILEIGKDDSPGVEYILVDPTCSGSGMQNRISLQGDGDVKDKKRISKLGGLQIKILSHAMTAFPDVKRIVYSTCSLYEEENEQVVQKCLRKCPGFKLLNGKKLLEKKWKNFGNSNYQGIGKNCIYSRPDEDLTDGIFTAVLDRVKEE